MTAIILAAGYATRLGDLTRGTPKALLCIGDKPILSIICQKLLNTGRVHRIVLVSNHLFYGQFKAWMESFAAASGFDDIALLDDGSCAVEHQRGAIGDIAFATGMLSIDEDCVVCAADNLWVMELDAFFGRYEALGETLVLGRRFIEDKAALSGFAVPTLDETDRVVHMVEKPTEPQSDIGLFALYIYPRAALGRINEYLSAGNSPDAPGYFPAWLYTRMPVYAYITDAPLYDIGTPEQYALVCRLYGGGM